MFNKIVPIVRSVGQFLHLQALFVPLVYLRFLLSKLVKARPDEGEHLRPADLIGASVVATCASAKPVNPGVATLAPDSQVTPVGHWKGKHSWKKRRFHRHRHHHHHDNDFRFGFGFPLFLGLGYGLGTRYYNDDVDCIGRWHRHYNRWHCHGQLVWD